MHYSVLVFGESPQAALDPFCENEGENPNGHWDWFQIGGRYRGRLLVRQPAAVGVLGDPGTFDNPPHYPDGVDQARWGDLDWPAMRSAARALAEESFAQLVRDYNADIKEAPFRWWMSAEQIGAIIADPEAWINASSVPLTCYAVVRDGKWQDRYLRQGGPDDPDYWKECTSEEWQVKLTEILAVVQPDELVTVVDCHS